MTIVGAIIGILIGALFSGFIIWVVGKLGWGLEVDGFVPAYIAAIVIAIISWLVTWLLGLLGLTLGVGFLAAIVHLVIAAIVLMIAGNFVKGLRVKGFTGALVGAIALAVVAFLIEWVLGLLM
ncbi:MAG: phage holin family protein [Anaerolineales bacterium]|jgi:putative membrane protein